MAKAPDIDRLQQPPSLRLLPMTNTRVRHVKGADGRENVVVDHVGPCVRDKVGMHQATIYDLIKTSGFPAPIKVGRRSPWIEHEIDAWIAKLVAEHRESA